VTETDGRTHESISALSIMLYAMLSRAKNWNR